MIPEWIVTALGLPNQDVDFYCALLRLIRNAFTWPSGGPITIVNKDGELSIVVEPDFIQAGPGLSVEQNPDGSFTITALGTFLGSTPTIVVSGTGSQADPYLASLAPGALIGGGSTSVVQNPDGTYTISTTQTPTVVDDSTTISHTGTGTAADPYIFRLTPTALIGSGSTTVIQNPDGSYTIDSSPTPTSVTDTSTITHIGTGSSIDPYAFSLAPGALVAGSGISVTQAPSGVFTIANTIASLIFGDSATNLLGGSGTVGDPYTFTFAPNSIVAGAGISVTQALNGVFTIASTIAALVLGDTPAIDVSGSGTLGDPYLFSLTPGAISSGAGIAVIQNPDGTFTISSTATAPILSDTAMIDVNGDGSVGTPYTFSFAAGSITAGTGIGVVQNPDGTYTISNTAPDIAPIFSDSDTIDVNGTGSGVDPYSFSLSSTAILPGTEIAVTQDPVTKSYTISSTAAALIFGNSATNLVSGTGTLGDPYIFTFAPNSLVGGPGISVSQAPDGTFTIMSTATAPIFSDSDTIDVVGDGSLLTPYAFNLTSTALTSGTGINVVQNGDGTFTISNTSPLSDLTLGDTPTIDVTGSGTLGDPYLFAFAAGSILAGTGLSVVQNGNGTFTISSTAVAPIFSDSDTIDVTGDGSVGTPYVFALTAGALLAGTGINVVQNGDGTFTISNTLSSPLFGNSVTNLVSGTGTVGDPYVFTFAPNSVVGGTGISVIQAPDGTFTISSTAVALVLDDTPTIDVSGTGTLGDPYIFSLTGGALTGGVGISVVQNPDDTFTITNTSPLSDLTLNDTNTVVVNGSGTTLDPYLFSLAPGALLAGTNISVVQNGDGTFTITNTAASTSLASTATISVTGDGSIGTPYEASLAPGALVSGPGISLTQAPDGVYTVTNTSPLSDLTLTDTATIDVSGTGALGDPYAFSFAPNSLLSGVGISLVQNPDRTYTITNASPLTDLTLGDSATIDVSGSGTNVDPYLFAFAANSILAGAGLSVVQNPNGTFTISSTATVLVLDDTDTIDVSGSGTTLDPYTFALTAGALLAGVGISVTQGPNGVFTITNTSPASSLVFSDTDTINVTGDGSVLTPYEFALAAGALIAGTGITVSQNPDGTFTIVNSAPAGPALVFGDSATNLVSGDGTNLTPYVFTFAPGAITAGTGILVTQNPDGTVIIDNVAAGPLLSDTATIDVSGSGVAGDPFLFNFAVGSITAGTGIAVQQFGDGTYSISSTAVAPILSDTATIDVGGDGSVGTPYTFSLASGALLAGTGISLSQAGNGVYTITNSALLQFWAEAYNATQDITSWNALDNSIVAFKNNRAFTLNKFITGTVAASSMGADSVDFSQGNAITQTAVAANSSILGGLRNSITVAGTSATIAGGTDHVINSPTCFVGAGTFHTIAVSSGSSGVLCGTTNKITGPNNGIVAGNLNEILGGTNSAILTGLSNTSNGSQCAVVAGQSHVMAGTNNAMLSGSGNFVPASATNSCVLGGSNNGHPTAATVWTRCMVGVGTGNRVGTNSTNAVVLAGTTNTATGDSVVIIAGSGNSNTTTAGTRNVIVAGSSNTMTGVASTDRDSIITTGVSCTINKGLSCGIFCGSTNSIGLVADGAHVNCSVVSGSGCRVIGTDVATNCSVLCGTTNTVNSVLGTPTSNSSVLSGNLVVITLSNTHNIASLMGRSMTNSSSLWNLLPGMGRKAPKPKDPCRATGISNSAAGGAQVLMQSSHSFAMGNQLRIGTRENDAQGSLTAGSYLENTKKHSTLIGSYGTSSTASQYEVLGVCGGTYTDPKSLMVVSRADDGRGLTSTDTLVSSGSNVAYLFPKSASLKKLIASADDVGYFVSLSPDGTVRECGPSDRVLGVTVPRSGIILNGAEQHWHGKYETDDFDRVVTRLSYVDSFLDALALLPYSPVVPFEIQEQGKMSEKAYTTLREAHEKKNNEYFDKINKERHDASVSLHEALLLRDGEDLVEWAISTYGGVWPELNKLKGTVLSPKQIPVVSKKFDPSLPYTPRLQRVKEWVPVVQKGIVKVRSDGSPLVGSLCTMKGHLATLSDAGGWTVLSKKGNVVTIML